MRKYLQVLLLILAGCNGENKSRYSSFDSDLKELQEYFHIPGMSMIVTRGDSILYENYSGYADLINETPMDSLTVIPMASLTKMFTGYSIAQISSRGALERPINIYVTDQGIPDSIKVKHVLSHTSEGEVGKHFHYSNRFRLLGDVILKEHQVTYEAAINTNITVPYDLNNTFFLQDEKQLSRYKYARPYVYDGEIKPGFIDYGFSASSGLTSTVRDLAKFSKMISHTTVETEREPGQLYNFGLFGQDIGGVRVLWAYGQYDCYSSLFMKVPEKDITFIIAGNNSLLSDPARLIYGDVRTSLFALSFLKNFLKIDLPDEQLKAKAVAESYLGMYDPKSAERSKELLRTVFKSGGDYNSLTTMHNISFLKEIARQRGETFTDFDPQMKEIGEKLLSVDKNDPYANIYLAGMYASQEDIENARIYYTRVAQAKNAERNWYTTEAEEWLKQHGATSAPGTEQQPQE